MGIIRFWKQINITKYGWTDVFNWWNLNFQVFRHKLGKDIKYFDNAFKFNFKEMIAERENGKTEQSL